jgi:UDP-N-acetylglucosamine 4-epimerase
MPAAIRELESRLRKERHSWLVTGAAGFIGSHLLEALLNLDQEVIGLDNFATGLQRNLDEVRDEVTPQQWQRFRFFNGDIRNLDDCRRATAGVEYVLHQAALGSVPRSLENPLMTHEVNSSGFLNVIVAARDAKVKRMVYASSSSVYGDHPDLPKVESRIGNPLSPYAFTKRSNEIYAEVFARCYGFRSIGLRYFNIFGPRQDPDSAYAAVIPLWISSLIRGEPAYINGDGETSRDFCYIANAVQINLLAATTGNPAATGQIYNVALQERTTLKHLFSMVREELAKRFPKLAKTEAVYREFRAGDVRHSLADISKARDLLAYAPTHRIGDGLAEAMDWYVRNSRPKN